MSIRSLSTALSAGLQRYWPSVMIAVICSLLQLAILADPTLQEVMAYQRDAVLSGQWYRLFSSALIHTNTVHLIMNLAGLLIISLLYHGTIVDLRAALVWILIVILGATSVLILYPETTWFVGLSGSLHGLLVWAALAQLPKHLYSNLLILLGVTIKLTLEQTTGGDPLTSTLIGARVLTEGHLTGALCGLILGVAAHATRLTK